MRGVRPEERRPGATVARLPDRRRSRRDLLPELRNTRVRSPKAARSPCLSERVRIEQPAHGLLLPARLPFPPILMDAASLFLRTLDDLKTRLGSRFDEYDVVLSSGLLRKLLLDSPSLVDEVNRKHRLKLRYRVNARPPLWQLTESPPPAVWMAQHGFDPDLALTAVEPLDVDRDGLLKRNIAWYEGRWVTVKDLIRYTAHVAGGVHRYPPGAPGEEALVKLAGEIRVGACDPGVRALQAVGHVVAKGLQPLKVLVDAEARPR